jgi:hypothetical protein
MNFLLSGVTFACRRTRPAAVVRGRLSGHIDSTTMRLDAFGNKSAFDRAGC